MVDPADEVGQLHRQVVRTDVERARWRKVLLEPIDDNLIEPLRLGQVLEPAPPEPPQPGSRWQALSTSDWVASDSRICSPCAAAAIRAARLTSKPR